MRATLIIQGIKCAWCEFNPSPSAPQPGSLARLDNAGQKFDFSGHYPPMISSAEIIRRRVRRRIQIMRESGMDPGDVRVVDPLTGQPPTTWERVEEILIENYPPGERWRP